MAAQTASCDAAPTMEVHLSRSEYRLGTAVVGTIRLSPSKTNKQKPRDSFAHASVRVVGKCRIDARWHNAAAYSKRLYNEHAHLMEFQSTANSNSSGNSHAGRNDGVTCIWATNQVQLLDLPERPVGDWNTVKPKPLQLPPDNPELYFTENVMRATTNHTCKENKVPNGNGSSIAHVNGSHNKGEHPQHDDGTVSGTSALLRLEETQLAFTFRADLPPDLPPTVSLMCCRYYYEVVVEARSEDGKNSLQEKIPFFVCTAASSAQSNHPTAAAALPASPRRGILQAMAHSSGLPCHVSVDDIYAPQGQTTILRQFNHGGGNHGPNRRVDAKTVRVADPKSSPCCILTAFGTSTMVPGGELLLQFDFPTKSPVQEGAEKYTDKLSAPPPTNCRLVSACLEGTETALRESYYWSKNHRTRTFLFDAASTPVEAGFTESVPLSLQLPLTAGVVSVHTDLVHVEISCRVDITVESNGAFTNLRLDLPVTVVHNATADELEDEEPTEEDVGADFHSMLSDANENGSENDDADQQGEMKGKGKQQRHCFQTKDILKELKILSLLLVEKWSLLAEEEKYLHSC